MKIIIFFLLTIITNFIFVQKTFSLGISTDFNNNYIENLQIGKEYSLKEIANMPLKVQNISDKQVKIKVQPVFPNKVHLREGFEIIPSTGWIKLSKREFNVFPGDYAVSDVTIIIPDDEKYLGKKFQVNIWSYISSVVGETSFLSTTPGVEGALLFSIAPVRMKGKIKPVDLNFKFIPDELFAVITSTYGFVGQVEIKNISKKTYKYKIGQISPRDVNLQIKEGYEILPEEISFSFIPDEIKIKKKKSKSFSVYVEIPEGNKYSGNKFMALIEVEVEKKGISGRKFIKTFIELK